MTRPRIYLAGPDVFRRDAIARGEELKRMCDAYEVEGLYPLDGNPLHDPDEIRRQCIAMIHSADAMVADISPFRGKHMDPGTAWEIGFAEALGKPVFVWSRDTRPMVQRIPGTLDIDHGVVVRDGEGLLVEDHGKPENLMIAHSRSHVHGRPEQAIDQAAAFLEGAEKAKVAIKSGHRMVRNVALVVLALIAMALALSVYARADIYVIDGDTIVVDREHIRLLGIDAPETRNAQCDDELRRGLEAKARLIDEITVACGPLAKAPASCLDIARLPKRDRYNRSLAAVTVQGRDVATTLIAAGLARPYVCGAHCPKRQSWCGG